jgi:hypothetical protein
MVTYGAAGEKTTIRTSVDEIRASFQPKTQAENWCEIQKSGRAECAKFFPEGRKIIGNDVTDDDCWEWRRFDGHATIHREISQTTGPFGGRVTYESWIFSLGDGVHQKLPQVLRLGENGKGGILFLKRRPSRATASF